MGAAALPLMALATVGLTAYGASKMNNNQSQYNALMAANSANGQNAIDTMPQLPEAPTGDSADAETNEAEAERLKQQQAMDAAEAAYNPTGGLGVSGTANIKKKTLGGGV